MQRRKDSKGRVLKAGESQRKNGSYMYRYTDIRDKRHTVYASDLPELRQKEEAIQKALQNHIDYAAGQITLAELIQQYAELKQNFSINTVINIKVALNFFKAYDIGYMPISSIKMSYVKKFASQLRRQNYSYGTIYGRFAIAKAALNIAVQEDILRKNPFSFKLSDYIPNNSKYPNAYTAAEQAFLVNFFKTDPLSKRYCNAFIILLGTGMRISELCGLTLKDLDFQNYRIHVSHQMIDSRDGKVHITPPKTESGNRYIPMSNEVYDALQAAIRERPQLKAEPMIDGYSGFIFFSTQGHPAKSSCFQTGFLSAFKRLRQQYPLTTITDIRPHHLRHTFCTNLIQSGVDLKTVQYVMGHSRIDMTLRVYTHTNESIVSSQLGRLPNFSQFQARQAIHAAS